MISIRLGEIKWGSPKSVKSEYSDVYHNDQQGIGSGPISGIKFSIEVIARVTSRR